MRITGGTARGRKLNTPKTRGRDEIRPTSDRVREALFNILGPNLDGSHVLDLYAGTGSLGLEALSRGASRAVFVDRSVQALELARRNHSLCFPDCPAAFLKLDLGRESFIRILARQVEEAGPFDLVFLDPPYGKKLAERPLTLLGKSGLLANDARVIVEERTTEAPAEQYGRLRLDRQRRYGETAISLYRLDK